MISLQMAMVVVLAVLTPFLQAQDARQVALEAIERDYEVSSGRTDVVTLVRLDQQLRALIPYWSWEGPPFSTKGFRRSYEGIGVRPLLFEPEFAGYSGKLLREAHAIDPRSQRRFTLYSTVFGAEGETGNTPPVPEAAEAYLREFPNGPFAFQAHLALGTFQSDLFQVIEGAEAGDRESHKHECYRAYVTTAPLSVQRGRAQASAIEHYGALTRLRPDVREFIDWSAKARLGRFEGWHYCGD
jgi:hypothetical protein